MARQQFRAPQPFLPQPRPTRLRRLHGRRHFVLLFCTLVVVLSGVIGGTSLLIRSLAAGPDTLPGAPSNLTFDQFLQQGQRDKAYHGPLILPGTIPNGPAPKHSTDYANLPPTAEPPTMKPLTQDLSSSILAGSTSTTPVDLLSSDGRLELRMPPGSLDVTHATVTAGASPSGALTLQVTQLHGHSIGEMNMLGSYQMQVVDSQGQAVSGLQVTQPITIVYHYQPAEMDALDLDPAKIVLTWPTLISTAQQANQPATKYQLTMQDDPTTHTLSAQSNVLGPGPFDMTGEPQNQSPRPYIWPPCRATPARSPTAIPCRCRPAPEDSRRNCCSITRAAGPTNATTAPHLPETRATAGRSTWDPSAKRNMAQRASGISSITSQAWATV